jgi:hypothetical protein
VADQQGVTVVGPLALHLVDRPRLFQIEHDHGGIVDRTSGRVRGGEQLRADRGGGTPQPSDDDGVRRQRQDHVGGRRRLRRVLAGAGRFALGAQMNMVMSASAAMSR